MNSVFLCVLYTGPPAHEPLDMVRLRVCVKGGEQLIEARTGGGGLKTWKGSPGWVVGEGPVVRGRVEDFWLK